MSKVEIIIESIDKIDIMLPGSFPLGNGKLRILQDEYSFIDVDANEKGSDGKPVVRHEHRINFTPRQDTMNIFYDVDDSGNPLTDMDKMKKNILDKFFCMHPLITVNGAYTPFTKVPMFNLVDSNVKANNDMKTWEDKRKVANMLADSDEQELIDICFYLGEDPKNRNKQGLLLFLADFDSGVLFVSNIRLQSFIKAFMDNADPMREYKIAARKSIEYGIVTTTLKEGVKSYYINGDFAGASVDHLVEFLRKNDRIYRDFIIREINKKEPEEVPVFKQSIPDSADKTNPIVVATLRQKVIGLMDELDKEKISYEVKRNQLQGAKYETLEKYYNDLIECINKVQS